MHGRNAGPETRVRFDLATIVGRLGSKRKRWAMASNRGRRANYLHIVSQSDDEIVSETPTSITTAVVA